ncbi:MAG TPA: PilZ domain-containing protein [Thermodesulfobacteriota bacterium]
MADEDARWGVASLQRRQHPRLDVSLPVEYVVQPGGDPRTTALRTLGGGGLLLVLPAPLEVGTRLSLTVYLPDNRPLVTAGVRAPRGVRADAVVVWADLTTQGVPDEYRCGVAFTRIADADRQAILDFIAQNRRS